MSTPRMMSALSDSLWITGRLCDRALALHPESSKGGELDPEG